MDVAEYTQALVSYAEQIDDIEPLKDERDALFDKLANGGKADKELVDSSINGKQFTWQVPGLTRAQTFKAFVDAIKTYENNPGDSPISFLDFSGLGGSSPCPPPCQCQ